jgi:hypothetical protein
MTQPAQNNTDATETPDAQPAGDTPPAADTTLLGGEDTTDAAPESTLLGGEDDAPAADDDKPAEQAPEQYEEFTVPEGFKLNDDVKGEFVTLAKSANLSQTAAQSMLDLATKQVQSMVDQQRLEMVEQRKDWVKSIKEDSEFGGAKLKETVMRAKRSLKAYGDADLVTFLETTGLGDHPSIIKLLSRVDRVTAEDQAPTGDKPGESSGPQTLASVLYSG